MGHHRASTRPGLLILALLALWVQALVPPGFMVAPGGAGPALVICTGHGPLSLDSSDPSGKAPKPRSDAPCVFAGHGIAAGAPVLAQVAAPSFAFTATAIQAATITAPGRGLAAPPPPARGPPLV